MKIKGEIICLAKIIGTIRNPYAKTYEPCPTFHNIQKLTQYGS